ncbi:MAG: hypothetical protein KatS3mg003_0672 [Candidatus Nitrosocaldaceae archaeon]|nr:MAG: hypothetical protein KatS3mg003_0672 [Candidatus Nitrosocaldaceae archaeon]
MKINFEITNNAKDIISKRDLYLIYSEYARTNKIRILTEQQFSRVLKKNYGLIDDSRRLAGRNSKSIKVWLGLKAKASNTINNNHVNSVNSNTTYKDTNLSILFKDISIKGLDDSNMFEVLE